MAARTDYSFTAAIEALGVGECATRTVMLNAGNTVDSLGSQIVALRAELRNSVMASVRCAQKNLSSVGMTTTYTVETFDTITPHQHNWLVLAVVARVS